MDWREYSYLLDAYRARFGDAPPTMLTPQGAVAYMRRALRGESGWTGEKDGADPGHPHKKTRPDA